MRWLERLIRTPEPRVEDQMTAALAAALRNDYATALNLWEPLARKGVARAQNNIGACFAEGLGVPRDHGLALRWLSAAAEAGDPVGQRNLANLCFKGEGALRDLRAGGVALSRRRRTGRRAGAGHAELDPARRRSRLRGKFGRSAAMGARRRATGHSDIDDAPRHDLPPCPRRRARPCGSRKLVAARGGMRRRGRPGHVGGSLSSRRGREPQSA